jgi:hypothetical protein
MNVTAINNLASLLENIPPATKQGFNMNSYTTDLDVFDEEDRETEETLATHVKHECNTTACIAGWAATWLARDGTLLKHARNEDTVDNLAQFDSAPFAYAGSHATFARTVLGLDDEDAAELFEPMNYGPYQGLAYEAATPEQAAKVLRHLAKTGVVDWSMSGLDYRDGEEYDQ